MAAARQFLGLDITESGEVVPVDDSTKSEVSTTTATGRKGEEQQEEEGGMSNGSKAVLLAVAMLQIGLLFLLSFDPMKATDVVFN